MGVLRSESSRLMLAKMGSVAEVTMGDLSSDGYVADTGVLRVDSVGFESVAAMALKYIYIYICRGIYGYIYIYVCVP